MRGLHIISIGQSHEDAVLGGDFVGAGFFGPMKWLVQPESTMDRMSLDGLRAGNRVLQENKLLKTK